ncbi:hypothetical protein [Terrabacter sp. MAHUQ-38]|uniref:hypothetical protein n=1 Tax=unclassified Terrabacter TaxID=2630222 RepID=UPI00165E32DC|nr:hypothetical protein [Terrabacter sp. MAHUQ-38]MBC9822833.1 hypothetical protein [Terrabacter sp. MAHUQ-38]
MVKGFRALVVAGMFGALQLMTPQTALAAACSAANPAKLTFESASGGVSESRIKLTHGEQSPQKQTYQFKVAGCDAGGLEVIDAEVRGLRDASAVGVVLVAKSADVVSLELDFKNTSLEPGAYQLTAVSKSAAAPLVYPINIDVRDPSLLWPILSFLIAGIGGATILALRAVKASTSGAKLLKYFGPGKNQLVLATGVIAMLALMGSMWWLNEEWFGSRGQVWGLIGALFGAMVTATTTATAASGAGAKVDE